MSGWRHGACPLCCMRYIVAALLLLHGGLHLFGFVKAWRLAALPELTGRTLVRLPEAAERPIGLLWLATCLLFLVAGGLQLAESRSWWQPACAGLVLSQLL